MAIYQHTFPNGLTLLAERMEHVRSAALNFLIPAGCTQDPPRFLGIASVLSDLLTRGAGERDSRELSQLRRRHYPSPLGHDRRGTRQGIANLNAEVIRAHYRRLFTPRGTILSVAGNIDWSELKDEVQRLFGDWEGADPPPLKVGKQ